MKLLKLKHWVPALGLLALAGCGGGSTGDTSNVGTVTGTQQYMDGIWTGTTGTGTAQRNVVGYVSGGSDGKGGDFYLAKGAAGTSGYDSIYGLLRVDVASVAATNVTYFSVQDGKFATGLTVAGTASTSTGAARTDTFSGNYSNPTNTAAATGAVTSIKMTYSTLNNYGATYAKLQGKYTGGALFGGSWVLTADAVGNLAGTVSGCTVAGTATPQTVAANSTASPAIYNVVLNLSGGTTTCAATGTTQSGVAFLKYDTLGNKTGIWMFTRSSTTTLNTYVLDGVLVAGSTSTPATTQQVAAGFWKSSTSTSSGDVFAMVLPDNSYFFYKRVGGGYDALYGNLVVATGTSILSSTDGVYFANQNLASTQYTAGILISGDVRTQSSFTGTYTDPTASSAQTAFSMVPDTTNLYTSPILPTVSALYGTYTSSTIGFGGTGLTLKIAADTTDGTKSVITGTTTTGCTLTGNISAYSSTNTTLNLYRVDTLTFAGTCALAGLPVQSGAASAVFDGANNVVGLRIGAAGYSGAATRSNLVFIGSKS